jgi:(E)-4-hydroxy-3-methylbut-2-enyl-diphosphate synthase
VAYQILASLGLRRRGTIVISCPACGRSETDLRRIAAAVEKAVGGRGPALTVAVMGCMVNGPGEAREADLGVACGRGMGVLFRNGRVFDRVPEKKIVPALLKELQKMEAEAGAPGGPPPPKEGKP